MKIVLVDELPEYKRSSYKHLVEPLEEFLESGGKYARVDLDAGDYGNPYSAASVFIKAVRTNGYPIRVAAINGEIYLIRKGV